MSATELLAKIKQVKRELDCKESELQRLKQKYLQQCNIAVDQVLDDIQTESGVQKKKTSESFSSSSEEGRKRRRSLYEVRRTKTRSDPDRPYNS